MNGHMITIFDFLRGHDNVGIHHFFQIQKKKNTRLEKNRILGKISVKMDMRKHFIGTTSRGRT